MEENNAVEVSMETSASQDQNAKTTNLSSELGMSIEEQMVQSLGKELQSDATRLSKQVEKAMASVEKATLKEAAASQERQENMNKAVDLARQIYRLDGDLFYIRNLKRIFHKRDLNFIVLPIITDQAGRKHTEAFNMFIKGTQSFRGIEYRPVNEEFITKKDGKYINTFEGFPFDMRMLNLYFPEEDPHCEFNFGIDPKDLPAPDTHSEIEHFLFSNICSENAEAMKFLMAFIHQVITAPMDKNAFVPVLQGPQGTGKTTLLKILKRIIGEGNVYAAESVDLESHFNSTLANRLIIFADEATFSDGIKEMNKLKNLTGGSMMRIELRGFEPYNLENYSRLIIATNEEWAASMENDNPRYILFKTRSSGKINFERLYDELKSDKAVAKFLRKVGAIGHHGYNFHDNNPPVFF